MEKMLSLFTQHAYARLIGIYHIALRNVLKSFMSKISQIRCLSAATHIQRLRLLSHFYCNPPVL